MTRANPPEPTGDQCSDCERLADFGGHPAFACWYPQMGGYAAKAVVVLGMDPIVAPGGCFDAYVWHDGEFPFAGDATDGFGDPREPIRLHHYDQGQFVEFGQLLLKKQAELANDRPGSAQGGA